MADAAKGKFRVEIVVTKPTGIVSNRYIYEDMDYEDIVDMEAAILPALVTLAEKKKAAKEAGK